MHGIQYLTDQKGRKEKRIPIEKVKTGLVKSGKLTPWIIGFR